MAAARVRSRISLAALLLAAGVLPGCAPTSAAPDRGRVNVEFVQPEQYTDFKVFHGTGRFPEAYLQSLRDHLVRRASYLLQEGQALHVAITDVDQAGRFQTWRPQFDGRVVRNVYRPEIALRFTLVGSDGAVLKQGRRSLSDPFLIRGTMRYPIDPLRHEKALLDDWLESALTPA